MLKKKISSVLLSIIFIISCLLCVFRNSISYAEDDKLDSIYNTTLDKVIVNTETWDYNGVSCSATIFEDGYVYVYVTDISYMYPNRTNTTILHSKQPMNFPVPYEGRLYCLSTIGEYQEGDTRIFGKLRTYKTLSYYPNTYHLITDENIDYSCCYDDSYSGHTTASSVKYLNLHGYDVFSGVTTKMCESVPLLTFSEQHTTGLLTFVPNTNISSGTYEFSLFSHTIYVNYTNTCTNDIYNNISRLDTNEDEIIDATDASTILKIYAINSTGGNIKTFEDLKNYEDNNI